MLSQVKLIAEPWDLGEGGYQVGNFPGRLGGMERQVSRQRARATGRATAAQCRRARYAAHRSAAISTSERPPPVRQHQFRHRARRLHPARSRQLQRQAQRSERRGQPRRRRTTTTAGTAASKGRPTIPRSTRCARGRSATCSPRCSLAGRADALGGDEIGRTQQGNNNAYCQDNELSAGSTGPGRGPERCIDSHGLAACGCAVNHATFRRPRFFPAEADARPRTSCGSRRKAAR